MKLPKFALLAAALVSVSSLQPTLVAQPAPAVAAAASQAEVAGVKFRQDRNWFETEIELNIKPVSGDFIGQTRVTLSLGVEAMPLGSSEKTLKYYRASAELVAVEKTKALVRFYLPPEITKRDRLRGDAAHYLVEVEVEGEMQKPVAAAASKSITTPALLGAFKGRVSSDGAINDGLLMPQYFTPFANLPAPTFLRREPQR